MQRQRIRLNNRIYFEITKSNLIFYYDSYLTRFVYYSLIAGCVRLE